MTAKDDDHDVADGDDTDYADGDVDDEGDDDGKDYDEINIIIFQHNYKP